MQTTAPQYSRPGSDPNPKRYSTASDRDKASLFATHLEALRYRDGKRQDYCSRFHYFADWIGGVPLGMSFNFMTQNRSPYPALANTAAYACLQQVETAPNSQRHFSLPTNAGPSGADPCGTGVGGQALTGVGALCITGGGFDRGDSR